MNKETLQSYNTRLNANNISLEDILEMTNSLPEFQEVELQEKEVTPTKEIQEVIPDEEYDGLNKVTVKPIPDEYIIPDGTLDVNANGDVDVTMFRMARVGVYTPPNLQDKEVTITENGTQSITFDDGYDGLNKVDVTVDVAGSGGIGINIFAQETEPETKDGIWLQTNKTYENVAFTSILTEWESNTSRTKIPFSFKAGGGGKVGDYVYLFGGSGNTSAAYKYNISTNAYTKLTNVPNGKSFTPSCVVGEDIYLCGLYNSTAFYKFNTVTEKYTTLASSPTALSGATFVNAGDNLYTFGRDDGVNGANIYKYSITNNSWSKLSVTTPVPYAYPQPFAIGTDIYMVSMRVHQNGSIQAPTTNYVFDTVTETFRTLTTTPPSGFIASAVYADSECVYLFGGENGSTTNYKYLPSQDMYIQLSNQPYGFSHSNVVVKSGDELMVFGGSANPTNVLSMYMKEPNPITYNGDAIVIYTKVNATDTDKSFKLFDLGDLFLNFEEHNTFYFDDVTYRFVTGEFDNTIPTYYGDGTQWIKFKN